MMEYELTSEEWMALPGWVRTFLMPQEEGVLVGPVTPEFTRLCKLVVRRTLALKAYVAAQKAAAVVNPLNKEAWPLLADQFNTAGKQALEALKDD